MSNKENAGKILLALTVFVYLLTGCAPQEIKPTIMTAPPPRQPAKTTPTPLDPIAPISDSERPAISLSSASELEALYILGGQKDGVTGLAFLPNDLQLASLSGDLVLSLWNAGNGALVDTLTNPGDRVYNVAFSRGADLLAVGNQPAYAVGLMDARNGQLLSTLKGNNAFIMKLVFSPDGTLLASGDLKGTIIIWNVESGEEVGKFLAKSTVDSLTFSPDGTLLASGNAEGNTDIQLWDVISGEELQTLRGHNNNVYNLVFTPDGAQLFSSSGDLTIKLWDLESGQEIRTLTGHRHKVYGLALSPDGTLLASASADGLIKLWEVESGRELATLYSHSEFIYHLAFSLDGSLLASGGEDESIILWGIPR